MLTPSLERVHRSNLPEAGGKASVASEEGDKQQEVGRRIPRVCRTVNLGHVPARFIRPLQPTSCDLEGEIASDLP